MSEKLDFAELKTSGILPSPKGVALTIIRLCQRDNISLPELAHTIQADPALAGRIIKIANAANPNKSRPIAAITTDTLILIGIHAVRQVVLGVSLVTSYQDGACKAFDYPRYWTRSVAMATAAQAIGAAIRIAPPTELFTCGLLASIGRLGIAAARPQEYSALLADIPDRAIDLLASAESAAFGLNHRDLSADMMADWGFPKLFIDAVYFHETPESSAFAEGSRQCKLTYTLQMASIIADIFLATETERNALLPQLFQLGRTLGMNVEQIVNIANQTRREWVDWGRLLNISTHLPPELVVPETETSASAATETSSETQTPPKSLRILVADDDDTLVFMLSKILSMAGHVVYTARNGRTAYDIAARELPQVIIADWIMPEIDGVALCRSIREKPWGRDIFYIILTTMEDEHRQIEAFEAGADAYLKKPFNPRLLTAKLMIAERRIAHHVQ